MNGSSNSNNSGGGGGMTMSSTTMMTYPQNNSKKVFEIDYSKRCGALEVQVAFKTPADNRLISHILFSKIFHGCWPVLKEVQALFEYLLDYYRFQRIDDDSEPMLDLDVIDVLKSKKKKKKQQGVKKLFPASRKSFSSSASAAAAAAAAANSRNNDGRIYSLEAEFDLRKPKSTTTSPHGDEVILPAVTSHNQT